jgi:TolB-like protein
MKWNRNVSTIFVGVVMALMGFSLTVGTLSLLAEQSQPGLPTLSKEKIAVMPFIKGRYGSDIRETLRCPLCNLSFEPEDLTFNCDQILTGYVQEALERHHEDMPIPFGQVQAAYEQIAMDATKDTPVTLAQRLGKKLDAHYVLLGTVWRYREREGGSRGVEKPASVSFSVHLIRTADGKFIWEKTFAETQRSLSENVLEARAFFERGAKWLTADELARYGVDEIMKDFPY